MASPPTAFSARQYEDAYPPGMDRHFWYETRNAIVGRVTRRLLREARLPVGDAVVLDVGCGPGLTVAALRRDGLNAFGVEIANPVPVEGARGYLHVGQDARDLPLTLRDQVRVLLLLDVLEHIRESSAFLRQLLGAFPNVRETIITVPARPEVWSNYDTHYGHCRRYTRRTLKEEIASAGLSCESAVYFFGLGYLAALLLARFGRDRKVRQAAPVCRSSHALLSWYCRVEAKLMRCLPMVPGLSLLAIGRRPETTPGRVIPAAGTEGCPSRCATERQPSW